MLPNHAPLIVAEQFGTLETLYPGRIDLGLGRAPGTDRLTSRALRRIWKPTPKHLRRMCKNCDISSKLRIWAGCPGDSRSAAEKSHFLSWDRACFGASVAAMLGLPFAFASHFAPGALKAALDLLPRSLQILPANWNGPYVMVAANVVVAERETEARRMSPLSSRCPCTLFAAVRSQLPQPVDDLKTYGERSGDRSHKSYVHVLVRRHAGDGNE